MKAVSILANGDGWEATIATTSGVAFTVEATRRAADSVDVALWTMPAAGGMGVAVLERSGEPVSLVTVPVCSCGERGCARAGRQMSTSVDGAGLRQLVDLVESLKVSGSLRDDDPVWQPESS